MDLILIACLLLVAAGLVFLSRLVALKILSSVSPSKAASSFWRAGLTLLFSLFALAGEYYLLVTYFLSQIP